MASVPSCQVWGIGDTSGDGGCQRRSSAPILCHVPAAGVPARCKSHALCKPHLNVTLATNVNKVHV